MSIAVSAVVKPSLALLAAVGLVCAGVILVGVVAALGRLGELGLMLRLIVGFGCIFIGVFAFYRTVESRKTHHIDISGNGQIRIGEYIHLVTSSSVATPASDGRELVQLMADSTIWPGLLLLRLKSEDDRVTIVNVLPDSIHGDGFRALSVACRWIAAHKNSTEDKKF